MRSDTERPFLALWFYKVCSPVLLATLRPPSRIESFEGATLRRGLMEGGYAVWMGQAVVLRVAAGNARVPLRGRLIAESNDAVRLRIADSWDVDIFKSMVLSVEYDNPVQVVH